MAQMIGDKLKQLRKENGLSQKEFRNLFNDFLNKKGKKSITQATISRWENNKTYPNSQNINDLAEFYNIQISEFQRSNRINSPKDFSGELPMDITPQEITELIDQLPSSKSKTWLLELVKGTLNLQNSFFKEEKDKVMYNIDKNENGLTYLDLMLVNLLITELPQVNNNDIHSKLITLIRAILGYVLKEKNRDKEDIKQRLQELISLVDKS